MSDVFAVAVSTVLAHEGGYVASPVDDPGGETHFGISRRSYPDLDIKALTREQAVEIYRRDYWVGPRLYMLPAKLAIVVFDAAVNQGATTAVRLLQRTLGVTEDGVIGPQTATAAAERESLGLLADYCAQRALAYVRLGNFATWGRVWLRRLFDLHQVALLSD